MAGAHHRFALVLAIVKPSDDMRGFVVLPKRGSSGPSSPT
jgi:hypothetical protein